MTATGPAHTAAAAPRAWRSWHLHASSLDPRVLETVVTGALPPVLKLVGRAAGPPPAPRPWFFIRYWQGGPHVRLRIADLTDDQADRVQQALDERLAEVDALLPAERRLTPEDYRRSAAPLAALGENGAPLRVGDLTPAGAHRACYEPEFARYGGPAAMALSEELFHASSVVCLRACAERADHRYSFYDGLELLAASLTAWPDPAEMLRGHHDGWRALLAGSPDGGPDWAALDRAAAADAARLAPVVPGLRALAAGEPSRWSALTGRLGAAAEEWRTAFGPGRARQILGSHLHMAHNRLGLSPLREAQLAAVLLRTDLLADGARHGGTGGPQGSGGTSEATVPTPLTSASATSADSGATALRTAGS